MTHKRYVMPALICLLLLAQSVFAEKAENSAVKKDAEKQMSIDLPSALRLLNKQNTELAIQLEKVKQAEIARSMSWYQWLPTLRVGAGYAWQDGALQHTGGSVQNIERSAFSSGLGISGTGSGLPSRPGLTLEIDLAEAISQPHITDQRLKAARATEDAARLDTAMQVAGRYYDLVKAKRGMILAKEALSNAEQLAKVTGDFADTGEGLKADADRASVELLLQQDRYEQVRVDLTTASARLAQLLRLKRGIKLHPVDNVIVPLKLLKNIPQRDSLVDKALSNRPELKQYTALVRVRKAQLDRERLGVFLPKVGAAYSYGTFSGGQGTSGSVSYDRQDIGIAVYWQLDNLGLSNIGRHKRQASRLREAKAREAQAKADVVASVEIAFAEYQGSSRQIKFLQAATKHARSAYELSRERIFENQGLPLEALQAMKSLEEVESLYLNVTAQYNLSQLYLLAATGEPIMKRPLAAKGK